MLAWRPGARSVVAGRGPESSDARDGAPLGPRLGRWHCWPAADLDMKIHLERNLEEERQILLQQQKICRNRARKYFVESNRRKKAFEEKRKEQEEREQQIREQILQQRKEKFEEVTEKFQRAHIPLSQRRRTVFQKQVPPLEEALKQIQESNLKSEVNLLSSHRPTINWRAIDNALPSSLSKNDHKHQKHLLSKINCGKEMKENNRANLATNKDAFQLKLEETQKLLEDQHLSSLQKFCDEVNQITNSETLSSLDSLEAGEHEEIYLTLNKEPSTSNENSISLKSVYLQSTNLSCFDEDKLSFSKTQHINNWLINVNDPNTETVTPFSDILSEPNVPPSCECFNGEEQNPPSERVTNSANHSVALVYSPPVFVRDGKSKKVSETSTVRTTNSSSGTFKRERPFVTESPTFKFSRVGTTPGRLTPEMAAFAEPGNTCELTPDSRTALCVPVATRIVLPCNRQSARPLPDSSLHIKEVDPVQCSDKSGDVTDVEDEKLKYFHCNKEELPLFSDDFQVAYIPHNSDSNDKKHKRAQTSTCASKVISNCGFVGQLKKMKYNTRERNGVRGLKSILKKESKYEHSCFKALVINHSLKLGNQKAAAIRDSIELTKEKGTEIPKTTKKLRWFDETGDTEGNGAKGLSWKNRTELCQQRSPPPPLQPPSGAAAKGIRAPGPHAAEPAEGAGPQEGSAPDPAAAARETSAAAREPGPAPGPLNSFMPSACNVAKQAWPPSRKEGMHPSRPRAGPQAPTADPPRGGAAATRRTRSAPVQCARSCTRGRDAVPRPRSAGRARRLSHAQGALPAPPPAPQSLRDSRSGEPGKLAEPRGAMARDCLHPKPVPPEHRLSSWSRDGGCAPAGVCSGSAAGMPSLPCCCSECQTSAQMTGSDGPRGPAQPREPWRCAHPRPAPGGSHPSPPPSTAREESEPLQKGQKDILGQKETAAGSTVVRRKRVVEDKQRSLLEHKRQNSASAGKKCNEYMNNLGPSVQPSSSEPKHKTRGTSVVEEVSDSTSQFLMAENLVKASVPEDEILTVMNSKQLQKPNLALNKTQSFNICALSAEEQKILQSLNRLNERLHCVQEAICKDPSIKNTLQIIPLLNSRPRGSPSPGVGSRLQRKY